MLEAAVLLIYFWITSKIAALNYMSIRKYNILSYGCPLYKCIPVILIAD